MKNQLDYIITEEQAKEFARVVFKDIARYIQEHQKEYKEYLNNANNERGA